MSILAAAGITAAAGAYTAYRNRRHQKREAKSDRQFAKEQAEVAHQRDKDFWKKQAEYNTPHAQMERLREAGLSPNLMYQQGSTGEMSGRVPQAPVPHAPIQTDYPDYAGALRDGLQAYMGIRENMANVDYKKQITINEALNETYKEIEVSIQEERDKQEWYKTQGKYFLWREAEYDFKRLKRLEDEYGELKDQKQVQKWLGEMASIQINKIYRDFAVDGIMPSDDPRLRMIIRIAKEQGIELSDLDLSGLALGAFTKINPFMRIMSGIIGGTSIMGNLQRWINENRNK